MNKKFKRIIALLLAVLIAMSCLAVCSLAADDAEDESPYDEGESFWKLWVEGIRDFFKFLKYIFYDVWLGRDSGPIPEAPTNHPVQY